ncbi:MAG: hypothetical protein ACYDBX_04575 [Patescibacteria group bacterium]
MRFDFFKQFYSMYKSGFANIDQAKSNVARSGHVLYKSEIEKFLAENPTFDAADFNEFLVSVGGLKSGGRVLTGGNGQTKLNSPEKMAQLGIKPHHEAEYLKLIAEIITAKKKLGEIIENTDYGVSFSITNHGKSKAEVPA